jgi:hypothetical protein
MEHLHTKFLLRTSITLGVLFSFLQVSAIETKRFDAPPLERAKYMAFSKPISLRYGLSPLPVDRTKLIMPPTIEVVSTTVEVDQNQTVTTEAPDFPLLSYDDNNVTTKVIPVDQPSVMQVIPQIAPPDNLPLSDPFEDINSLGIDSTDQLLEVFENSNLRAPRTGFQQIPFVPPYTVAPDNLRVTNRATYQRRQR